MLNVVIIVCTMCFLTVLQSVNEAEAVELQGITEQSQVCLQQRHYLSKIYC